MRKANILIIEDHDAVRLLLGMTFKRQFHVVTKRDGLEGLAWLSAGNFPDLIVLDMEMPRLNGLGFLRQLRSSGLFSQIPVLLVSGNTNNMQQSELFELGIVDFMAKPFNPSTLYEKVKAIVEENQKILLVA
jgi:DNA-binding response OmpR family regulator